MAKNKHGNEVQRVPVTGQFFETIGHLAQEARSPEERSEYGQRGGNALKAEVEAARNEESGNDGPRRFGR
jgi:hypothetical protein